MVSPRVCRQACDRCVWSKGTDHIELAWGGGLGSEGAGHCGSYIYIRTNREQGSSPQEDGSPGTWLSGGLTDGSKGPVPDHKLSTEGKVTKAQVL